MFPSIPGSLDSTMGSLFSTPSTIDDLEKKEWKQVWFAGYIHCKDVYLLQNFCGAGIHGNHTGRLSC